MAAAIAATAAEDAAPASAYVPLRSIWLLQLYASELYRRGFIEDSGIEQVGEDIPALLISILNETVSRRLARDLSVGFRRTSSVLSRVRGRIDVYRSERDQLFDKGMVRCKYNHLTADNLTNRFLLRALEHATRLGERAGHHDLARHSRALATALTQQGVQRDPRATEPQHRLGPMDIRPVTTASLLLDLAIPQHGATARAGLHRGAFAERELRRLFESALAGLYRHHLESAGWTVVTGKRVPWPVGSQEVAVPWANAALPQMITDIVLRDPHGAVTVVDAKFTAMATSSWRGGATTLKSSHLYQLLTYVSAAEATDVFESSGPVRGALVYAALGENAGAGFGARQQARLGRHEITVGALDLMGSAREIREAAVGIVTPGDLSTRGAGVAR